MTQCADNHKSVIFDGGDCPVCTLKLELDRVLDDQEEIDQANIAAIFKELTLQRHDIDEIRKALGLLPTKRWRWVPKRHAQVTKDVPGV